MFPRSVHVLSVTILLLVGLLALRPASVQGAPVVTTRESVSSQGGQATGFSFEPVDLSPDGQFVTFGSYATNLVPDDTNRVSDIFLRDRRVGVTERISISDSGGQANNGSDWPVASADGRYVAFRSYATNLVPDDTNGHTDIFVRDRQTGRTERINVTSSGGSEAGGVWAPAMSSDGRFVAFAAVSDNLVPELFVYDRQTSATERVDVSSTGEPANDSSFFDPPSISDDGRIVAFVTYASNLVPDDTNETWDVFVRDRQAGTTSRVSISSSGSQANGGSFDRPAVKAVGMSANGRFVTFVSSATNLVPGDTNSANDIFIHDRETGTTERVSITNDGQQANNGSSYPDISADGRFVAFASPATNFAPESSNYIKVFVRDRVAGSTTCASVSYSGGPANNSSVAPSIAADGRSVAYVSEASNLVVGDSNRVSDIFVSQLLASTGGPIVQRPSTRLAKGAVTREGRTPVKISWSAGDASGITGYALQQRSNDGPYQTIANIRTSATVWAVTRALLPYVKYQFRVVATNTLGQTGFSTGSPPITVLLPGPNSPDTSFTGTWTDIPLSSALGGSTRGSVMAGATARVTFNGRQAAWIAERNPAGGLAEVRVDDTYVTTINLYAMAPHPPTVVYRTPLLEYGLHILEVRVLGTGSPESTGVLVGIDAFVVVR